MKRAKKFTHYPRTLPKVQRNPLENAFGKWNDCTCEIELCLNAWLNGYMRNMFEKFLKLIQKEFYRYITCNHTVMQSYLATAKTGFKNR